MGEWPLRGEQVSIRPLRPDELDLLLGLVELLDQDAAPAGVPDRERLRVRIERSGHMRESVIDLGIEVDDRLIGVIQTHRNRADDAPPDVFEVGIAIYRPEDRGRGAGTEAMRLFVDWLFEQHSAARVRGGTAVTNEPMRKVFEGLGFRATGRAPIHGVEEVLYELTRSTWEERSP
jgi:RimJ/RimL family protein N-acetyltransferase